MADNQSIESLLKKTGASSPETSVAGKFEEKMASIRLREKEEETQAKAAGTGVPYVNLKGFPVSPEALSQIPREQADALKAVCFLFTGSDVRVAAVDPAKPEVKELVYQLEERLSAKGGLYAISEESFRLAEKLYDALPKVRKIVKGVKITEEELGRFQAELKSYADIASVLKKSSVTDIMTVVMAAAFAFGSSDVHVEAEEKKVAVRFRIDGILQDVAALPHEEWKKIIARVKLVSGLKINVTDRPQDGRFTIFLASGDTDVRVSTIPTTWGESVVMRILKPSAIAVDFASLGFRPPVEGKLLKEIAKPHGMIITTGPTGSGKTTTLYAILRKLNRPEVKIITLEDPIEYKLEGVNQSQIDHEKQYTFAGGLRSILRQDPDVVMVGEIRDLETAETAINAALTGHLMLSTLHTNDASGALPRFIAMGVKPFLLAPSLNAIIGQRLVRKIHEACKEPFEVPAEQLEAAKKILADLSEASGEKAPTDWKFFRGKGCDACNHTGYKGRIGIYEVLLMDETVRAALSESISEYKVREIAKTQGMVTMQQDGILKAIDGVTTVEEVLRVAGEGV
jgi:type IV pilus assembly protein PilB